LPLTHHIDSGELLLDLYNKTGGGGWKIITIVRDIVAVKTASFFENLNLYLNDYNELILKDGSVNAVVAANALMEQFSNFNESKDYVCTWFDQEIKQMAGIDVFSHPFDHKKGCDNYERR